MFIRNFWVLLLCYTWPLLPASAKDTAIAAPLEISLDYSYVRANQGPGQCGCFAMNGGSTEAAFPVARGFSAVADLTGERSGSVNGGGPQGLSLVSFTAGPRFARSVHRRYAPFAQALFGGVHGFDSYFPVTSGPTGAANSFAMIAGGGLDIRLKSHLAIRPIQVDYFLTHLPNGVNDRQNNLRVTAGIVFRIFSDTGHDWHHY
jgi:hypothetical protein